MTQTHVDIMVEPDIVSTTRVLFAPRPWPRPGWSDDGGNMPVRVVRRSIDARAKMPRFLLRVAIGGDRRAGFGVSSPWPLCGKRVVVVGAGPGGYFAALTLLEAGIVPVLLERGRDVRARLKDVKKIYSEGLVNPHSNYCFGEGGAGTYSDGKLYTRATKRGSVDRILDLFVAHRRFQGGHRRGRPSASGLQRAARAGARHARGHRSRPAARFISRRTCHGPGP